MSSAPEREELRVETDGPVRILILNRPEKRNAFTLTLLEAFEQALTACADDESVRAVVITGAGEQAFCAGIDVGVLFEHLSSNPSADRIRKLQFRIQELFGRLEVLEKPTIAAIEGSCMGGGLELALCCDFRVASGSAKFGFPEARIGMLPDLGGTVRMARLAGPAKAKEWILTARQYSAEAAQAAGLLNELCEAPRALERAKAWGQELSLLAPRALGWAKRVVDRSLGHGLAEGLLLEQDAMVELLPSEDLKEGVLAFLEKRAPRFTGK